MPPDSNRILIIRSFLRFHLSFTMWYINPTMILRVFRSLRRAADSLGLMRPMYSLYKRIFGVKKNIAVEPVVQRMREFLSSNTSALSATPRSPRLIVSLTSFPERVNDSGILPIAIFSIMEQTLKPDKIVLWLTEEEFPERQRDVSSEILRFCSHGLEIRWIPHNIRAYGKLVPALEEFPDDVIVTADDDVMYDKEWLEKLYNEWLENPSDIIAHRVKRVAVGDDGVKPYNHWNFAFFATPSFRNFLTGVGGVLYPPHALHENATNEKLFKSCSPLNDDIWFWAMAVLNGKRTKRVKGGFPHPLDLIPDKLGRRHLITENLDENDSALERVFSQYPQLTEILLEEHRVS